VHHLDAGRHTKRLGTQTHPCKLRQSLWAFCSRDCAAAAEHSTGTAPLAHHAEVQLMPNKGSFTARSVEQPAMRWRHVRHRVSTRLLETAQTPALCNWLSHPDLTQRWKPRIIPVADAWHRLLPYSLGDWLFLDRQSERIVATSLFTVAVPIVIITSSAWTPCSAWQRPSVFTQPTRCLPQDFMPEANSVVYYC